MSKAACRPARGLSFADRLLWSMLGFFAALLVFYGPDSFSALWR